MDNKNNNLIPLTELLDLALNFTLESYSEVIHNFPQIPEEELSKSERDKILNVYHSILYYTQHEIGG